MNNGKFRKYWIISGTLAFVILFAFLVVEIYTRTIEDEKKDYQLQQLEMAKNAAAGISYLLNYISSDMNFLTTIPEIKRMDSNSVKSLNKFLYSYESKMISSIFIFYKSGKLLCSSGSQVPELTNINELDKIVNKIDNPKTYLTKVVKDEKKDSTADVYFEVIIPINNVTHKNSEDIIGYLGYLINFNLLVNQYIKPLKLSKQDFAWIIDSDGRLIYHPSHHEMLFRSINNTTKDCFDCHVSFDAQKLMLKANGPSVGEYYVINDQPAKVMAYYPINILKEKWILVISADVTKVTESLRGKFKIFFILGFVILGVILFFSILIYYVNLKRVRAEEAKGNLEQVQLYQEQLNQASKDGFHRRAGRLSCA